MNKLQQKVIGTAISLSLMVMATSSAQAAQVSPEQAVSEFVLVQGKQVMAKLSEELQQSITQSVEQFSINQFLGWEKESVQLTQQKKSTEHVTKSEEE